MAGHTVPPSRRPLHACAVSPPLHERGIQCAPAPTRLLTPSPPATAALSPTGHSWRRPPELVSTALAAPPLLPSRSYKNSTRTPATPAPSPALSPLSCSAIAEGAAGAPPPGVDLLRRHFTRLSKILGEFARSLPLF
jgi:hypothetical protein